MHLALHQVALDNPQYDKGVANQQMSSNKTYWRSIKETIGLASLTSPPSWYVWLLALNPLANYHAHNAFSRLLWLSELLVRRQGWLQVAECDYAIGGAVFMNSLPISKLRRIKELIEVLGGASRVAKMLLDVVSECFSFWGLEVR